MAEKKKLKVLCLDGTKKYLASCPVSKGPDDYDLICGNNMGGILAILFGALRIPLVECIEIISDLTDYGLNNNHSVSIKTTIIRESLMDIVSRYSKERSPHALFRWDGNGPRVFISTSSGDVSNLPTPVLFSNYEYYDGRENGVKIWEAMMASISGPPLLEKFKLRGLSYIKDEKYNLYDTASSEIYKIPELGGTNKVEYTFEV